ncbi:hypothetical protein K501DRAFT_329159 [Backusella circina FSU 941]|nr:hypothetical protein K501DRAFT_329159 [Backusella circina FSU 941]
MTTLSILDQPYARKLIQKQWYIILFSGFLSVTFISYYLFYLAYGDQRSYTSGATYDTSSQLPIITDQTIQPSNRSIHLTVGNTVYGLHLDSYPLEDNIIRLFAGTRETVTEAALDILTNPPKKQLVWTERWLDGTDDASDAEKYSCTRQAVPYPILRRMVKEYVPVGDANSFFDKLDYSVNFTHPFVFLPFSNKPILRKGHKLCVRIVVPFLNIGQNDKHQYKPYRQNSFSISYPWWDTMMTSLREVNTNASIPIVMQPWPGHYQLRSAARQINNINPALPEWAQVREDEMYERERMHMYQAEVTLPHEGQYELSSLLEFVEGRYNFEYGPVTPYTPVDLPVYPRSQKMIHVQGTTDTDLKLLEEHLALPVCTRSDHAGRWLPWPKQTTQSRNSVAGLNRENRYWAPYECRYRHYSYELFNRCISRKYPRGIELYGDSNIRRSIKKFVSHGQWCKHWEDHLTSPLISEDEKPKIDRKWTESVVETKSLNKRQFPPTLPPPHHPPPPHPLYPPPPPPPPQVAQPPPVGYLDPQDYTYVEPEQTRSCYCEDYGEPRWNGSWFDAGIRRFNMTMKNTQQQSDKLGQTEWDKGRSRKANDSFDMRSYKWDGLTFLNYPGWDTAIDDSIPKPSIAVFSLGNWDAAFLELNAYLADVDRLIAQIKQHYDLSTTRIVYRTPQYYCCRVDTSDRHRQVSGPRVDIFDWEVRVKFIRELDAIVWNTMSLGESRTWEEKIQSKNCPSNHVPADEVEIENQVFMNGLCNTV